MSKYESSIEWGENYNMLKKSINTSVTINGNYLEVKSVENERFTPEDKRHKHPRAKYAKAFNPFFLGEKTINVEDILSVKIKNARIFGFFTIFGYIIYIIMILAVIYDFLFNRRMESWGFFLNCVNFIVLESYIIIFPLLDVNECYKYKSLHINFINEKSICIPIENWKKNKEILHNFENDIKSENPRIKIKDTINRNKKIKILIFIISVLLTFNNKNIDSIFKTLCVTFFLAIPFFWIKIDFEKIERKIEKNLGKIIVICCAVLIIATVIPFISYVPSLINKINYEVKGNQEEENKQLIIDKKCYTEVNVVRAILKESKKQNNGHFKNTYTVKDTGEEIEFEETYYTRYLNNEYYIWIFKYYLKENNKLLTIKYDSFNDESDYESIYMYDTEYIFDKYNNKIIKFYNPKSTNKGYSSMIFRIYLKKDENKSKDQIGLDLDKIYKIIYSSQSDIIQQKKDYKYFKLVDTFSSHYGKCYVIKYDNDSEKIDYYMYTENNNVKSDNDYDGIFIIYKNSPLTNDNNAISYFKEVISLE